MFVKEMQRSRVNCWLTFTLSRSANRTTGSGSGLTVLA